jgi:hypothetical protein
MRLSSLVLLASAASALSCGSSDDVAQPDAGADATLDRTASDAVATDTSTADAKATVRIAAAGDISEDAIGNQKKTSDLLVGAGYDAVLLLGDDQYPDGTAQTYASFFDPTWGRVKSITRPAPGNHDYHTPGAAGYYGYFGAAAGDPTKGYYSYDLGAWHVIALNTNDADCGFVACDAASAQVAWLKADLAAHPATCTLAYWHHPRFNSGASHGDFLGAQAIWDALYAAGADVVLNGHEHVYERFDPQTPTGKADPQKGIRQFTVGTGGIGFYAFGAAKPNSVVREASSYGVLEMTLKPNGYDWRFVAVAPSKFTDAGSGACH